VPHMNDNIVAYGHVLALAGFLPHER
jgi:hypothetical protein